MLADYEDHQDPSLEPITFPRLRTLYISCTRVCRAFLVDAIMPRLLQVTAGEFLRTDDEADDEDVATLLGQRSPLLEKVGLCFDCEILSSDTIAGFSALNNLRILSITGWVAFLHITDDIIEIIPKSLSSLQHLSIAVKDELAESFEVPTRKSLISLAEHCRSLTDIQIPLSFRDLDPTVYVPHSPRTPSTSVIRLTFSCLFLPRSIQPVARFLTAYFPKLLALEVVDFMGHPAHYEKALRLVDEFDIRMTLIEGC